MQSFIFFFCVLVEQVMCVCRDDPKVDWDFPSDVTMDSPLFGDVSPTPHKALFIARTCLACRLRPDHCFSGHGPTYCLTIVLYVPVGTLGEKLSPSSSVACSTFYCVLGPISHKSSLAVSLDSQPNLLQTSHPRLLWAKSHSSIHAPGGFQGH